MILGRPRFLCDLHTIFMIGEKLKMEENDIYKGNGQSNCGMFILGEILNIIQGSRINHEKLY